MVTILRRAIALVALAVGIGVAAGAAPATAATTHHASSVHVVPKNVGHYQLDDWWF